MHNQIGAPITVHRGGRCPPSLSLSALEREDAHTAQSVQQAHGHTNKQLGHIIHSAIQLGVGHRPPTSALHRGAGPCALHVAQDTAARESAPTTCRPAAGLLQAKLGSRSRVHPTDSVP